MSFAADIHARELDAMRDELRQLTMSSSWDRLAARIAAEIGALPIALPAGQPYVEPAWEQAAPGIECKLLTTDTAAHRVGMLVRLAPGAAYPPHRHGGVEELHLLEGELIVEERTLYAGDYNRAERGTSDRLVWSKTGCTCVLITSTQDELGP